MDASFDTAGFLLLPGILAPARCQALTGVLPDPADRSAGSRTLLRQPWCAALSEELRTHPALAALLPVDAVAIQATLFEKSADVNWLVGLHQDLSVPVADRVESPALRGWAEKEGQLFVQPPAELLERLVALRLHLDDCGADDGPLKVVPGTHREGRLEDDDAFARRDVLGVVSCEADCGDVLALRPLLLHASSRATGRSRRRVLHLLYAPPDPGHGLHWARSG